MTFLFTVFGMDSQFLTSIASKLEEIKLRFFKGFEIPDRIISILSSFPSCQTMVGSKILLLILSPLSFILLFTPTV